MELQSEKQSVKDTHLIWICYKHNLCNSSRRQEWAIGWQIRTGRRLQSQFACLE
jgi:hypothetical protein